MMVCFLPLEMCEARVIESMELVNELVETVSTRNRRFILLKALAWKL